MNVHRTRPTAAMLALLVQSAAAAGALAVVIVALPSAGLYPRWPLTIMAVVLGAGLVAGSVVQRLAGRSVAGATQTAALGVVLGYWSSAPEYGWTVWPEVVASVVLGVGLLVAGALTHGGERSLWAVVQPVTMTAALVVCLIELSRLGVFPRWPLAVAAAVIGAGLLAAALAHHLGGRSLRTPLHTAGAVGALVALMVFLSASSQYGATVWPEAAVAGILGAGLIALGVRAQWTGGPREQMLSARVTELSRTRTGALDVQASELRRIERDLHDGAQARLVALSMKVGRAEDRFSDDSEMGALLREVREDATAAIRELRELARGIAPPVLTDRGLEAAVRSLAQRSGGRVTVSGALEHRPLPAVETAAYFVVAESLTNAAKHAPDARVEVRIDERGGDVFVEVTDFGPGDADPHGAGLTGLRQRVEALDGALHVTSPSGVGTQIEAVLPARR